MENKLNFIKPEDAVFYISPGNLLMLKYKGEEIGRVSVLKMFPFQCSDEFLCVRSENYTRADKENEIGIIRFLSEFPDEQADIIKKELEKRYFMPEISKVIDIKEEIGHITWNVLTSAGEREFTVTDMSTNIRRLNDGRVLITDVYSNRYFINDISKLPDKALKVIEIWI